VRQWKQNLPHISSPFKYGRLETKASKPYITGNGIASIMWLSSPPASLELAVAGRRKAKKEISKKSCPRQDASEVLHP